MLTAVQPRTHTVHPDALAAIAKVGRHVTHMGVQYRVHQVEGFNYYAFLSSVGDTVTVDFGMPDAFWLRTPLLGLLPIGAKIDDGIMIEVPIDSPHLRFGVSLRRG